MSDKRLDDVTGQTTTGHSYDGIEELNTPLPRWWLWTFYITIIWGIGYTIAYPAWPLISGATSGVLGYSTRGEVAAEIETHEAKNADLVTELLAVSQALMSLALKNNDDHGKANAAQAIAKIAITTNPEIAFPGERAVEVVRPLVQLLHPNCTGLMNYEALLALTNLASMSDTVRYVQAHAYLYLRIACTCTSTCMCNLHVHVHVHDCTSTCTCRYILYM